MNTVTNNLARINKAIWLAAFLAVVLILEANGVDVPVDVDGLWEALFLLVAPPVAVFLAPSNKGKLRT